MLNKISDGLWKLVTEDKEGNPLIEPYILTKYTAVSERGISALGLGDGDGGDGGGSIDKLDSWANYTEAKADFYAPASLLVPFRDDTLSRLASLEAGGGAVDIDIAITGSGNAVTGVSKVGDLITFNKGLDFSLSNHTHTKAQVGLSNVDNTSDLLKPISNATQTALNGKLNLTGGTLSNTAKLEIINNSVGISNVLQLTNTSYSGRQGTSIFFKGYYNQALISSSQIPSSAQGGDLHLQTYSNNSVLNTGIYLDRTGNVGINTINPSYKLDVSGTGRFTGNVTASVGINTPKVDFGNGFTIEPSGTELVFKYQNVIKQRMLSNGTILATGGMTALTT